MGSTIRSLAKRLLYSYLPFTSGSFPYYGSKVFFPSGSAAFEVICEQGIYEREILRLVTGLVTPDSTMFDVGANIGLMALPALQHCASCRVVSFEPSPSSTPYLRKTISNSGYGDRWTLREVALAAGKGEQEFCLGDAATALYEGFRSETRITGVTKIKVPVTTLDEEWGRAGKPELSLIKIDVEGAEEGVLAGAANTLRNCRPHIITEWHEPYLREFGTPPSFLLDLAKEFGYLVFGVSNGVNIQDASALRFQMLYNANFALVPTKRG